MNKPNILYIHSHDTGRYIKPYGHAIETPNLQKLAEQGVLFRNAFTASPTCSPSRACLLTGQSAHSNGMLGLSHFGFSLDDYNKHIIHTLKKEGYKSYLAGIQHIESMCDPSWKKIGYDEYLGDHEKAHEKAAELIKSKPTEPFFLSVGFFETHKPHPLEHPLDDPRYILPPAPLPDTKETREHMARFKQQARVMDKKMGMVFDALEESGIAENTLIICTTDHGIPFPGMKCNLEDSGTGVMLLIRGPGGFCGGKVVDSLISQIDIYPTICDLLGIDKPSFLEGKSFMPIIKGEREKINEEIFSEINYHVKYEPARRIRTKRFKYIKRFEHSDSPVLPNCDDSLSKNYLLENGWISIPAPDEVLYDLIFDPNEKNNLINDPAYKSISDDLKNRLHKWMEETKDPLLKGPLIPPATSLFAKNK